jgi:hypothetical protein
MRSSNAVSNDAVWSGILGFQSHKMSFRVKGASSSCWCALALSAAQFT